MISNGQSKNGVTSILWLAISENKSKSNRFLYTQKKRETCQNMSLNSCVIAIGTPNSTQGHHSAHFLFCIAKIVTNSGKNDFSLYFTTLPCDATLRREQQCAQRVWEIRDDFSASRILAPEQTISNESGQLSAIKVPRKRAFLLFFC